MISFTLILPNQLAIKIMKSLTYQ